MNRYAELYNRIKAFSKDPDPDCVRCNGKGFYYNYNNWARTCACKL